MAYVDYELTPTGELREAIDHLEKKMKAKQAFLSFLETHPEFKMYHELYQKS